MNKLTYIVGRFYEVRARRAYRKYLRLKEKSEVFFARIGINTK